MLKKIETKEIKTIGELRQIYSDYWFRYIIVEKDEDWLHKPLEEVKAIVIYLADNRDEFLFVPQDEIDTTSFYSGGNDWGVNVNPEPGIQIGGIEIAWP